MNGYDTFSVATFLSYSRQWYTCIPHEASIE